MTDGWLHACMPDKWTHIHDSGNIEVDTVRRKKIGTVGLFMKQNGCIEEGLAQNKNAATP